ncbi:MAG TPA: cupin domain-containing protein [Gammaproteobacteria bacterium]
MAGYLINIELKSLENEYFREVLFTGPHSQLVVMALKPAEDIGLETHGDVDQFIRIESGHGMVVLDEEEHTLGNGAAVVIPAGTRHNIVNTSKTEFLKLYTVYSPPEHPQGTVHKTKAEAMTYERELNPMPEGLE